ncbi:C6 zinc finger [Aspergillus sp. HF37]|nr:C6 zinc finger [Aspergillus sp. HF37]
MALRRPHRKSRHGCFECKKRRVKCDEARPICSNCSTRQSECEYDSPSSLLWTNEARYRQRSPRTNLDASHGAVPELRTASPITILGRLSEDVSAASPENLNLMDLELLLQWCNSTHKTLSRNPRVDPIWRYFVTDEAVVNPFLMHGILAVSALNLARTKPDSSRPTYIGAAVAHQNQALALFRELLGDINPSNAKAMFAFASIVVVYAFGFPHTPRPSDPGAAVDDLYQVLVLCQGVQHVIHESSSSLRDSSFSPLLQVDDYTPYLPEDAGSALERLREANHACGSETPLMTLLPSGMLLIIWLQS